MKKIKVSIDEIITLNSMDWRTSFDCDSFLDKERNHHGYYWLDTVALTSFIENLLEQERTRIVDEIGELYPTMDSNEARRGYDQARADILFIINKK